LGQRIETSDTFDLITEEVNARGLIGSRREYIDDTPPSSNGAWFLDEGGGLIAMLRCPGHQVGDIKPVTHRDKAAVSAQIFWIEEELGQPMYAGYNNRRIYMVRLTEPIE
jgi:hypothetical protein